MTEIDYNLNDEVYDLCLMFIKVMNDLRCQGKISEEDYISSVKLKLKAIQKIKGTLPLNLIDNELSSSLKYNIS